jgi:signal transduction histidine kinase/CheY-like chemotaxis protein
MDLWISMNSQMREAQIDALYRNVAWAVISAALASVVLTDLLFNLGVVDGRVGTRWSVSVATCAGLHLMLRQLYGRTQTRKRYPRFWPIAFATVCLLEGLSWGWATVYLVRPGHFDAQVIVVAMTLSMAAGSSSAFGSYLPAYAAFFLASTLPYAIANLGASSPIARVTAPLMLIYVAGVGGLGIMGNRNFRELVGLRLRTSKLADELLQQKELAELANLAKSSFLAAASHDLRQPVHALGLFVGALRGVVLSDEAAELVDHIEASTAAMDTLFSALLDISRLDAGVVEVHPQTFAIGPLLARICREHSDEVDEKGLALICRPTAAWVNSDPVLVERIARNLISNAIRYTQRGRILVGCRVEAELRVQVWDTGPGIAPALQQQVFQEYFQLANPERDRAKGLGLGLAIVRRLTDLLGSQITLRSRPGHGSCFSFSLPVVAAPVTAPIADLVGVSSLGPARGLIAIVDDESAIRQAMAALLTGWGYEVAAAGSQSEILEVLSSHGSAPDLVICDYRLRDDETGIRVIETLRAQYGAQMPAMLITGDTAPDRLLEARASGLLLLHKPVSKGKLRAALVNLMQTAEGAPAQA